jgi:hypothetical protein
LNDYVSVSKEEWDALLPYRNQKAYDDQRCSLMKTNRGDWVLVQNEEVRVIGRKQTLLQMVADGKLNNRYGVDILTRVGMEDDPCQRHLSISI